MTGIYIPAVWRQESSKTEMYPDSNLAVSTSDGSEAAGDWQRVEILLLLFLCVC